MPSRDERGTRIGPLVQSVIVAGAVLLWSCVTNDTTPTPRLLLHPLQNRGEDPSLEWLSVAVPEMLASELSGPDGGEQPVHVELATRDTTARAHDALPTHALWGHYERVDDRLQFELELAGVESALGSLFRLEVPIDRPADAIREIGAETRARLREPVVSLHESPVLRTNSSGAAAAYRAALDQISMGSEQGAIPHLRTAIDADPSFAAAYARLVSAFHYSGEFVGARKTIEDARRALPAHTLVSLDRLHLEAVEAVVDGSPDAAASIFEVLARNSPSDAFRWYDLGVALELNGQTQAAISAFTHATALAPRFGAALLGEARNYVRNDQGVRGAHTIERGLKDGLFSQDDPTMGMVYSILGGAHLRQFQLAEAEKSLESSLEFRERGQDMRGTIVTLSRVSYVNYLQGDLSGALARVARAHRLARESENEMLVAYSRLSRGNILSVLGRLREAERDYRSALDLERKRKYNNHVPILMHAIAQTQHARGESQDAHVLLLRAGRFLDHYPDARERRMASYLAGLMHRDSADFSLARTMFRNASRHPRGVEPAALDGTLQLAALESRLGQVMQAMRTLDGVELETAQQYRSIWGGRAELLRSRFLSEVGAKKAAQSAFPALPADFAGELQAARLDRTRTLAELASLEGDHAGAIQLLESALAEPPATDEPWIFLEAANFLAEVHLRNGEPARALEVATRTAEEAKRKGRKPIWAEARYKSGAALLRLGRPQEALDALDEARPIAQSMGERAILLGEIDAARHRALTALDRHHEAQNAGESSARICQALLANIAPLNVSEHRLSCTPGRFWREVRPDEGVITTETAGMEAGQ